MKNFEDVFKELLNDHRKVEISEVAKIFMTTLSVLDKKSNNFAKTKKESPKGYIGLINTLTLSMLSNFAIIGKGVEGAVEFSSEIKDDNLVSMAFVVVNEGDKK